MWRIIYFSLLAAILSQIAFARETMGDLYFAIAKKTVVIDVTERSVFLTETIDCITQRLENTDYEASDRYIGLIRSSPLLIISQNKEARFFDTLPSISITGDATAELQQNMSNPLKSDGVYLINITFLKGAIPKRFEVIIKCHKEIETDIPLDFVYRWDKHNPKPVVVGHPIDWGPYELRVNCDKLHLISLKKGIGWVETSLGKASIDLEGSDSIELGITPRSKDDPVAKIGQLEDEATADKQ